MAKGLIKSFTDIHTQLKLKEYKIDANSMHMVCQHPRDGKAVNFILVGHTAVKRFPNTFRIRDYVNIVAEGVIVRRMSKGVNLEV